MPMPISSPTTGVPATRWLSISFRLRLGMAQRLSRGAKARRPGPV